MQSPNIEIAAQLYKIIPPCTRYAPFFGTSSPTNKNFPFNPIIINQVHIVIIVVVVNMIVIRQYLWFYKNQNKHIHQAVPTVLQKQNNTYKKIIMGI